jgi:hypothetical protein
LPHDDHGRLALLLCQALSCSLRYESGNKTFKYAIAERLWRRLCSCLNNTADIRLYEKCIQRIHVLARDDDETEFFEWSLTFWTAVVMKSPEFAADYVEDFFKDIIERDQTRMASLLPVSILNSVNITNLESSTLI